MQGLCKLNIQIGIRDFDNIFQFLNVCGLVTDSDRVPGAFIVITLIENAVNRSLRSKILNCMTETPMEIIAIGKCRNSYWKGAKVWKLEKKILKWREMVCPKNVKNVLYCKEAVEQRDENKKLAKIILLESDSKIAKVQPGLPYLSGESAYVNAFHPLLTKFKPFILMEWKSDIKLKNTIFKKPAIQENVTIGGIIKGKYGMVVVVVDQIYSFIIFKHKISIF